jgi:hypothetical protein
VILNRRKLIGGIGLLIAAPAIVRAESLMRIKVIRRGLTITDWNNAMTYRLYSGFDTINLSPEDALSAAKYEWAQELIEINGAYKRMLP